jgi:hypothetical protein
MEENSKAARVQKNPKNSIKMVRSASHQLHKGQKKSEKILFRSRKINSEFFFYTTTFTQI